MQGTSCQLVHVPQIELEEHGLTICTPSFEGHHAQFVRMIESIVRHCTDLHFLHLNLVVEEKNVDLFSASLAKFTELRWEIKTTEDVLEAFGNQETSVEFLKRAGKFTFQTVKKFGALLNARTAWSLVLDSEGEFHKPFSAEQLLRDYQVRKYVFYTETEPRGERWLESTGYRVTKNAEAALGVKPSQRWYMENFHWFYETEKVRDLVRNRLGKFFFDTVLKKRVRERDFFENILYYSYLQNFHGTEYQFYNFKELLEEHCPEIAGRFVLDELPFALHGNDYLLNVLAPQDVKALAPLFDRFRLNFVRLEPPRFDPAYVDELDKIDSFCATISSQYLMWLRKRIAVCVSGEFRHFHHRTPEHQLRHLVGFLSGVECDVFVHSWQTSQEALIRDILKPVAAVFEERRSFDDILDRIEIEEAIRKPRRDEGSLSMFYSMQRVFDLMSSRAEDYDYVVRIRPDLYSELSLKEILTRISDNGDFPEKGIIFPRIFASKGVSDIIAIGRTSEMNVYGRTYDYIEANVERLAFNPEMMLLRNVLEAGIAVTVLEIPFALLREKQFTVGHIYWAMEDQKHVWWSRTDDLPELQDLSDFFWDKLLGMEAMMKGTLARRFFVNGRWDLESNGAEVTLFVDADDWDPRRPSLGFFFDGHRLDASPFVIRDDGVAKGEAWSEYLFAYDDGDELVLSQWHNDWGKMRNARLRAPLQAVREHAGSVRIALAARRFAQVRQGA